MLKFSCHKYAIIIVLSLVFVTPALLAIPLREGMVNDTIDPGVSDGKSWYFAVSGDSRDCGDLIMPKIAQAIKDRRQSAPVKFYWHLGDLRRMFSMDCDIAIDQVPGFQCAGRTVQTQPQEFKLYSLTEYQRLAWGDFVDKQIKPFEGAKVPFFLGIGNHELIRGGSTQKETLDNFRTTFKKWLTADPIEKQRAADRRKGIPSADGETYYHFENNGADLIYLDNGDNTFKGDQIKWLLAVLDADSKNSRIKTVIVGMHEALPFSKSANHAMDASCDGTCVGSKVYDMLYELQTPTHAGSIPKHVYVLASHSHYFQEDIYNTPEHKGRVLPGWIIGTAGAEQYREEILYGYAQIEVRSDGTINLQFNKVDRDSVPKATGPNAQRLTQFCFEQNKVKPYDNRQPCPRCPGN